MPDGPARDFTYIKPRKRRVSEYEAVSLYVQSDPAWQPRADWFMRTAEGRAAWDYDSTRLKHPDWFSFRDPARHWQRTYVRMQAEQENAIERTVEDAAAAGSFERMDRAWLAEILGTHYRVWSYFEYALFRAFGVAQREALADPIGHALTFQGFDHMRHAQDVVLYLLAIEDVVDGFEDDGKKERWLEDPVYQPLRQLAEELVAVEDWAELCIVANDVVLPLIAQLGVGELIRENAPAHRDITTPFIVLTTERDRRRNQGIADELTRMSFEASNPHAEANREVIREWIALWAPRVARAAEALEPVWERIPRPPRGFPEALKDSEAAQRRRLEEAGLGALVP